MKISEIGIFFARNPIFTTPGAQKRTRGNLKKIGQPADDAAWHVGGTRPPGLLNSHAETAERAQQADFVLPIARYLSERRERSSYF